MNTEELMAEYTKDELRDACADVIGRIAAHRVREQLKTATRDDAVERASEEAGAYARAQVELTATKTPLTKQELAEVLVRSRAKAKRLGLHQTIASNQE